MIPETKKCPECGGELPANAPEGLCPRCLAGMGLRLTPEETKTVTVAGAAEQAGDRIGRYKLLEKIGEGGCGVVYLAEQQEPVWRRVALKVIKLGMDTRQVVARFEAERQALALMDHPNIAKVLDGGATEAGRPYFVMELVKGVKITDYCDQHNLSPAERLKLFVQVCQAIQHAHQKGIIHRDIKPSNILVTLHDPDKSGVPKVIDFGIAKATEQPLTDKTLFTAFNQFIGTPAYMSPEQAELSGLDIDTRSDIYALGVLLYELLTGKTPFDTKELLAAGLDEMRRTIREKEPVRPSTKLSTMAEGDLTTTAKHRQCEAPKLIALLRGDLDWVVMKALEKDRTRRYETANGLATDVQRYLADEPVVARPPSQVYRFRKLVRRNKVVFAATASVALSLVLGIFLSATQAFRATRAQREQRRLRSAAEQAQATEAAARRQAEADKLAARRNAYAADMNLAQRAFRASNIGGVLEILNAQRPRAGEEDLRAWEWRYLWQLCQSDALATLGQSADSVQSVAFSPDGRRLAAADWTGRLTIWDLASRRPLFELKPGDSALFATAFSPDGRLLAAGGRRHMSDGVVRLWDAMSSRELAQFQTSEWVKLISFSPDSKSIAGFCTGALDCSVRLWDIERRCLLTNFPAGQRVLGIHGGALAFSPHGDVLAVGEHNGHIRMLDPTSGQEKAKWLASSNAITAVAFSPDGDVLASASGFEDKTVRLWGAASGKARAALVGHDLWVAALAFSPDGKLLASTGADQSIRLWDAKTGTATSILRGHLGQVCALAFSPDGAVLASGSKDGSIGLWDSSSRGRGGPLRILPVHARTDIFRSLLDWATPRISFSPIQAQFALLSQDGSVALWDTVSLDQIAVVSELGTNNTGVLFTPDGRWLLVGDMAGRLKMWDVEARQVSNLVTQATPIAPLTFLASGKLLVTTGTNEIIQIWDAVSWDLKACWLTDADFNYRSFSPDGTTLACGTASGMVSLWDVRTRRKIASFLGHRGSIAAVAFISGGRVLATSGEEGVAKLWEVASQQPLATLRGDCEILNSMAVSPDEQRLATTSACNAAVTLWDLPTRRQVATLEVEGAEVFPACAFSPDGNVLIAINGHGRIHVWRVPSIEEIQGAEAKQLKTK
jgi:eukaryotic-like serine/threonine-protein kinase